MIRTKQEIQPISSLSIFNIIIIGYILMILIILNKTKIMITPLYDSFQWWIYRDLNLICIFLHNCCIIVFISWIHYILLCFFIWSSSSSNKIIALKWIEWMKKHTHICHCCCCYCFVWVKGAEHTHNRNFPSIHPSFSLLCNINWMTGIHTHTSLHIICIIVFIHEWNVMCFSVCVFPNKKHNYYR